MYHDLFFWIALYLAGAVFCCGAALAVTPEIADRPGVFWFVLGLWPIALTLFVGARIALAVAPAQIWRRW